MHLSLPEQRRPTACNDQLCQEVLNVLGKLFESVIYTLPVTSHWKTYSKGSAETEMLQFGLLKPVSLWLILLL